MENRTPQNDDFLRAYDEYADAIFRYCYFRVFDREKAHDLTQETFMRAWEYLAKGNRIENFRAFLYRVATNLIIDQARKKGREVSLEALQEEGFEPSVDDDLEKIQALLNSEAFLEVLQQLDREYREVVVLRYVEDLTPGEIAAVLGERENTVSVRIHRGLKKLKRILEQGHGQKS